MSISPSLLSGTMRNAGPMFRASASPLQIRRPAPRPGEHQQEVLAEPPRQMAAVLQHRQGSAARLALEGVRIVDLSRAWAGLMGRAIWRILGPNNQGGNQQIPAWTRARQSRVTAKSTAMNTPSR